jgi:MerR family transcriptional regulator/heat shock protein HspR
MRRQKRHIEVIEKAYTESPRKHMGDKCIMVRRRKDTQRPLLSIRYVSQMLEVHPQTLRLYEREGLSPLPGSTARGSIRNMDVQKLAFIIELTRDLGVNRAE